MQSDADAIILDLEDSVSPARKQDAREIIGNLDARDGGPQWWVRINPIDSEHHRRDLKLLARFDVTGIVLPKAESGADITHIQHSIGDIPIHAIVTETPASLFGLLSYRDAASPLTAMSWGAEDLSAALGASSKYDAEGELAFTYQMARSLCLAGAVAAGAQPVDGVHTDIRDLEGLAAEAKAAASEGFTGKLAIHPAQVAVINEAFTPSESEIAHAKAVVDAFKAEPDAGVLDVGGKMVDRPHLIQAQNLLARRR